MNAGKTVFAQLMDFIPAHEFSGCVGRYQGNYKVSRKFPRIALDDQQVGSGLPALYDLSRAVLRPRWSRSGFSTCWYMQGTPSDAIKSLPAPVNHW
jgi:hypothetical protein